MNTPTFKAEKHSTPLWLKIVAGIGVIWYAFGLMQFWLGYSLDINAAIASGAITAAHGAAISETPALIWLSFAIASGAGLIGAALLFGASTLSKTAFAISLASAVIYYAWVYGLSGTGADRPSEEIIIAVVVVTVTAGYLILSRRVT